MEKKNKKKNRLNLKDTQTSSFKFSLVFLAKNVQKNKGSDMST